MGLADVDSNVPSGTLELLVAKSAIYPALRGPLEA
jgi:hypothetical protein